MWIAMIAVACFVLRANRVLCFWMAYILTRPFGAAWATATSLIFSVIIVVLVEAFRCWNGVNARSRTASNNRTPSA
jgi:uncharacterized membrane-anchored protein